jgi:uncharacterized protein YcfJ
MNHRFKLTLGATALLLAGHALAQVTLYQDNDFHGRVFSTARPVDDLNHVGFNDRASSVVVDRGRWEVCDNSGFGGHCVVLQAGSYNSLRGMGLNDRVSSLRPAGRNVDPRIPVMAPPMPSPNYEYRRRPNERLYEAPVLTVHAVVGPPEQRCWVERQQVQTRPQPNVGRGLLGAVIGGVIGHQIGGGSGRDLATVGGAVAGGVIGARTGPQRGGGIEERDVQHCRNVPNNAPPDYWDVTYRFHGTLHRVQMTSAPGATVTVNGRGEPRG